MLSFSRLLHLARLRVMALCDADLRCPVCGHSFRSPTAVTTSSFASRRTDFNARTAGTEPRSHIMQCCMRCGYSGPRRDFAIDPRMSAELRAYVLCDLPRKVKRGSATTSEKYEAAAEVAERRRMDVRYVGDLFLRAAWSCVDEKDSEAERFFRRKAARKFEQALRGVAGVSPLERAMLTYLVGELWRRVGDRRLAGEWFTRVASEVVDPRVQRWVIDAARQQRDCPHEWVR